MSANHGSEQTGAGPQDINTEPERKSLAGSKRRRKADSTDFIASGLTRRFGSAVWSLPCLHTLKPTCRACKPDCRLAPMGLELLPVHDSDMAAGQAAPPKCFA